VTRVTNCCRLRSGEARRRRRDEPGDAERRGGPGAIPDWRERIGASGPRGVGPVSHRFHLHNRDEATRLGGKGLVAHAT